MKTILVLLSFFGCAYKPYQLRTGEIVECKDFLIENCGMSLYECKGQVEYHCQYNVKAYHKKLVLSQGKALDI